MEEYDTIPDKIDRSTSILQIERDDGMMMMYIFSEDMSLEAFRLWSDEALRSFLQVRKKTICGTSDELACR